MFAATLMTAAIAVAALSVGVVMDTDTDPLDAVGATHVVAADGSGDFTTIQAAVDAASPGDIVRVAPGTYSEAIVIDKDLTLTGDGRREDVIVSSIDGVTPAVTLRETASTMRSITVSGVGSQVLVDGGAPRIEDVAFHAAEAPDRGVLLDFASLAIDNGSQAEIVNNEFTGAGVIDVDGFARPLIQGNQLSGGSYLWLESAGPGTIIRANTVLDSVYWAIGLGTAGELLIEDNDLTNATLSGIVGWATGGDLAPVIRNNRIVGNDWGISLPTGVGGSVEGNVLQDNEIAIVLRSAVDVRGNEIVGEGTGVMVLGGGAPQIAGNTIEVQGRGIVVNVGSSPVIDGNAVCGGEDAIWVAPEAAPVLGTNEIC